MYSALLDRRHSGATRIRQCTRRGPFVPSYRMKWQMNWCVETKDRVSYNAFFSDIWYEYWLVLQCDLHISCIEFKTAICITITPEFVLCAPWKYANTHTRWHACTPVYRKCQRHSGSKSSTQFQSKQLMQSMSLEYCQIVMTSSNRNIFLVTGSLCGEFAGHRWIHLTKSSDVELWCFLWSAPQ